MCLKETFVVACVVYLVVDSVYRERLNCLIVFWFLMFFLNS